MSRWLALLILRLTRHRRPPVLVALIIARFPQNPRSAAMTDFALQTDQRVDLSVQFLDARGNEATVDGQPTWGTSDPALLRVNASPDGLSASAVAVGPTGRAQIQLTADARLGDDVAEIHGVLDLNIIAAEAVTAVITPGTISTNFDPVPPPPEPAPTPQPAPTEPEPGPVEPSPTPPQEPEPGTPANPDLEGDEIIPGEEPAAEPREGVPDLDTLPPEETGEVPPPEGEVSGEVPGETPVSPEGDVPL